MKKILVFAVLLAMPMVASAQGLVGDCYDCHTMHASEEGAGAVMLGDGTMTRTPIENLLRMDCIACHANDPASGTKTMTMTGGSIAPQVAHGGDMANSLAGGNFSYVEDGALGVGSSRKGHNVSELFGAQGAIATQWDNNEGPYNEPPGLVHTEDREAFTVTNNFDAFTCAGARGCHGTRDQLIGSITYSANGDGNFASGNVKYRVGMAAISGAHHDNWDGKKLAVNAANNTEAIHQGGSSKASFSVDTAGYGVVDGYRFIRGLSGWGNEVNRWENNLADHNEYFGDPLATFNDGCNTCHLGSSGSPYAHEDDSALDGADLVGSRMGLDSTIITPNNTMSGFCSSCHGKFHSAGTGNDYVDNGVSGAFLRHPSDYVIPTWGEYGAYTSYQTTAPVARPALTDDSIASVTPGTDMVMCLSCHVAHASDQDFMLRFNYDVMTAGAYTNATSQTTGGCLACHSEKGVLPELR
jgi:hypothetical protein